MDFMTDKELVLILIMLKKKKFLPSKKFTRFWLREIFQKRAAYGLYNNLVHEVRKGYKEFYLK